jgi:hypothetical protein
MKLLYASPLNAFNKATATKPNQTVAAILLFSMSALNLIFELLMVE